MTRTTREKRALLRRQPAPRRTQISFTLAGTTTVCLRASSSRWTAGATGRGTARGCGIPASWASSFIRRIPKEATCSLEHSLASTSRRMALRHGSSSTRLLGLALLYPSQKPRLAANSTSLPTTAILFHPSLRLAVSGRRHRHLDSLESEGSRASPPLGKPKSCCACTTASTPEGSSTARSTPRQT